jgi:hypothetical protein
MDACPGVVAVSVAAPFRSGRVRSELVSRVRAQRPQLEEAIFTRIQEGAASPAGNDDAEYVAGLRTAVAAAVEHALSSIEAGQDRAGSIPAEGLAQARRAARVGVSIDTVLRRYVIGSNVLGDFLLREADGQDFADRGETLRQMMSTQAAVLDGLLSAITDEYSRELERLGRSPEQRHAERVRRLLAGGHCDAEELGYRLESWHVAAIAAGAEAADLLKSLAGQLGASLLCVPCGEQTVWGWLGGGHPLSAREFDRALDELDAGEVSLALGEAGRGLEGWRISHLQAQAALRVALRCPRAVTHYADVALLASVLHDNALAGSLVDIYLSPLGARNNGGAVLRETLRAYFAAERNASSAASALGVTRHTVQNRLRTIEERLGQSLRTRQAELEVALRLEELGDRAGERAPDGG